MYIHFHKYLNSKAIHFLSVLLYLIFNFSNSLQQAQILSQNTPPNDSSSTFVGPSSPPQNATKTNTFKNCIQLAACAAHQILPMQPKLPADLFTSCLTTPIKTALKWFTLQKTSPLVPFVSPSLIDR